MFIVDDLPLGVSAQWRQNSNGEWEHSNRGIVTIPGLIGDARFAKCNNLTSVIIEDGVKNITNHAFLDCNNLKSITIPDSVGANISFFAFKGCSNLTNINASEDIIRFVKATKDLEEPLVGQAISYHAGKITVVG